MVNYIDENEVQNSELIKELESINLSITVTYIVALSVLLSFLFFKSEKTRVIDQLNGIPYAENRQKLSYLPKLSNKLLILTLIIAVKSNLEVLSTLSSLEDSEKNRRDIKVANDALLASILGLVAAIIVYQTLTNTPDTVIFPFDPTII